MCRLAELNVIRQVFNIATSNIVQAAWERGQPLAVHGIVYSPGDGLIKVWTGLHELLPSDAMSKFP